MTVASYVLSGLTVIVGLLTILQSRQTERRCREIDADIERMRRGP